MVAEAIRALLPEEWPVTIGELPSTRVASISVEEYDGVTSTEYFGAKENSSIFQPIIKIVVRDESYVVAKEYITQIKEILHRYYDDFFQSILMIGAPLYLGYSTEKFHTFQITFRTRVKECNDAECS